MPEERRPVHLLAGGRPVMARRGPDPLIESALRQAGVKNPTVAYVGAASKDNAAFRVMMTRLLHAAGAGEVRAARLCGRCDDPGKAMRVIESCHVVFVSGGDVEAGMGTLGEKGMVDFLLAQCQNGKPFFGASAGSIMLAQSWLRWGDPEEDSSAELFPCLGIAPVCCDTHGEKDGWEELRVLTRLIPAGTVTYGISSGAALVVNPDGSVAARGGEVARFTNAGSFVRPIAALRD